MENCLTAHFGAVTATNERHIASRVRAPTAGSQQSRRWS